MAEILLKVSYRIIDLVITILSFIIGYFLADFLTGYSVTLFGLEITFGGLRSLPEFVLILFIIPFIWWAALNHVSVYNSLIIRNWRKLLWALIKANVGGGILLFGLFFLAKLYFPNRSQLVFFLSINVLLLFIEKRVIVFFWRVKKQETSFQRILLVGMDPESRRFARHIQNYPELGYKIVGCLTHRFEELDESPDPPKIIGSINQIEKIVRENPVDEVIIFSSRRIWETMDVIAGVCEDMGIRLTIVPQWPTLKISHITFRKLVGTPLLSFVPNPNENWYVFVKRVMDFVLSLLVLILFSPLLILIALLIKWDTPGPVFFIQKRCGLNGREFSLIKFRSMVQNAENIAGRFEKFERNGRSCV